MRRSLVIVAALAFTAAVQAAESPPPYQGYEARDIKALSEKDVADLLAGRGAGYALAAELNGHPGPLHVLDLAEPLALSPDQRSRTQASFDAMQAEAKAIGAEIVAAEKALDAAFAAGRLTDAEVTRRTEELGRLYGRYRAAHLKAHLDTKALLTPHQIARYSELRGYSAEPATPARPHHRLHH